MDEEPYITDDDLKPCPFCGCEADVSQGSKGDGSPWWYVECLGCAATAESVEDWNRRSVKQVKLPCGRQPDESCPDECCLEQHANNCWKR